MRIGLLIQDIITEYSGMIIKGAKEYCLQNGIEFFVFIIRSKNWAGGVYDYQHYACKSLATDGNLDGIILVTSTYCQYFPKEQHKELVYEFDHIPLVSLGEKIPGKSCVLSDSENSIHDLLNYLRAEQKCERIFFVGPESNSDDIEYRMKVFCDFTRNMGIDPKGRILHTDYTGEAAANILSELKISKDNLPFDALVCANDEIAFGCVEYLKNHGIHVPDDVKVSGFDNLLRCDSMKPGITSIDLDNEGLSYAAARLLHDEIVSGRDCKENLNLPSKIIYRESTGSGKSYSTDESPEGKYFQLREHVYRYQYFLQNLEVTDETENTINLIIDSYKRFGIKSCLCCLYESPKTFYEDEEFELPEKARIFFAYNQDKVFDYGNDPYLNPKTGMIPKGFSFAPGSEVIVTTIFNYKYQYGYVAYTPGDMDYSTYELISTTTGISLAAYIDFKKKVSKTEKLNSEKMLLEAETYFDEMTGVLNRRGLYKYGLPSIQNSIERNLCGGIIFGDMDHLKKINDTYGHEAGDKAIVAEVEILKKVFRTHDVIARLGGDEFVVVACGLSEKTFNEKVRQRLEVITKKYNDENSNPFSISISLGYAEFDRANHDLDLLMKEADRRLYEEKVLNHRKSL